MNKTACAEQACAKRQEAEHASAREIAECTAKTADVPQSAEEPTLRLDGDNTYPDCKQCAHCCEINVICASPEEVARMRSYAAKHDITPIDYHKARCCFSGTDGRCMIWEARPQICRLYNCHVPRREILRLNPQIVVDDDKPLIDIHDTFIWGDASDPRYRAPHSDASDPRYRASRSEASQGALKQSSASNIDAA